MTDHMTRRPGKVTGAAAPGRGGVPLVPTVLLADADDAARSMVRDALLEGTGPCDLRTAGSTQELEEYLGGGADRVAPRPALILLDNDLPDAGALDAVRAIKCNPEHRRTPVVVVARHLTPQHTAALYDAGANTVIAKPVTFLALVKLMKVFTAYWLDAADLPEETA